jgi:hypothetical protein
VRDDDHNRAIGVTIIGPVFFGHATHSLHAAFTYAVPLVAAPFVIAGALGLALPKTAVSQEQANA